MIYLASQSPRRAELLEQIGVAFEKLRCEIDETPLSGEQPEAYVLRMATEKAARGWKVLQDQNKSLMPLLAADTSVACDGQILGKPVDENDARRMLKQLSGRKHQVITAVSMTDGKKTQSATVITDVQFNPLSSQQIGQYIASGEPFDKAGAYGIQGFGAVLVATINGSYSSVVGLPLSETAELLRQFSVPFWNAVFRDAPC